ARRVLAYDRANEAAYQHLIASLAESGDRSSALQQFEQCKQALHEELNLPPSAETLALAEKIKREGQTATVVEPKAPRADAAPTPPSPAANPAPSLPSTLGNMPRPLTSFIGRGAALAEVRRLLTQSDPDSGLLSHPLLTIVGQGGSGKTRLSIQVARELAAQYAHGAWWVELAPLNDGALVLPAIAKSIGVKESPEQTLIEVMLQYLRDKRLLLVLDNCEHLIDACASAAEQLLTQCEGVQVLATSREALNVSGEVVWRIPVMSLPSPSRAAAMTSLSPVGPPTALSALMGSESLALFVARAQAAKPDFAINERSAAAIIQICRRLDGIPLAIELAANRIRTMSAEQIAARLDDKFNLLTGGSRTALPRQQTLRALIDWSYDLLDANEQALFCQLARFRGGFSLKTIDYFGENAVVSLMRLVEKSMVVLDENSPRERYHILETVREYGLQRLAEDKRLDQSNQVHLKWAAYFLAEVEPKLWGAAQAISLNRFEDEIDNLRLAFELALAMQDDAALASLVRRHHQFWVARSRFSEAFALCEHILAHWQANGYAEKSPADYAFCLFCAGEWGVKGIRNMAAGCRYLEQALQLAQAQNDLALQAKANRILGMGHIVQGQVAESKVYAAQALVLFEQLHDPIGIAATANDLGEADRVLGNFAAALENYAKFRAVGEAGRDARMLAIADLNIGLALVGLGNMAEAQRHFRHSATLCREIGEHDHYWYDVSGMLQVCLHTQQHEHAAQLHGAFEAEVERGGMMLYADDLVLHQNAVAQLRAALGAARFDAQYQIGRALSSEAMFALAFQA
ncbi:MAG: NB-ARC domain-containing protein, partial [Anaerolineae bacterium]|nr:NB-ARC domain-containing protein [Anaerolineae bacterium]